MLQHQQQHKAWAAPLTPAVLASWSAAGSSCNWSAGGLLQQLQLCQLLHQLECWEPDPAGAGAGREQVKAGSRMPLGIVHDGRLL
jgi:hypothetical protein